MKQHLLGLAAVLAATVLNAQENYSAWSGHRDVFLNTTATTGGANVAGDVTGFPVLIRLQGRDSAIFAQSKAGGADVRFTKADGSTRLKHQIESWDPATRTATIWVRVDTVLGNNKTQKIRMHWGKNDAADSSSGGSVFTTAGGFFNVWHLGDAAGVANRPSSVTGGDSAVPTNFDPSYVPVAGVVGKAESLRGGTPPDISDYFALGSGSGYSSYAGGFTFSVWAYPTEIANQSPFFCSSNGYAVEGSDVIIVGRQAATETLKFRVRTGAGAYSGINNADGIALEEWQHFAFVREGNAGTTHIYKNGVEIASSTSTAAFAVTDRPNNYLGGSFSPQDNNFAGMLDEARLSKTARSANWIKLEYENQRPEHGLAFFDSAAPTSIDRGSVAANAGFSAKVSGRGVTFQVRGVNTTDARVSVTDMHGRTVWSQAFPAGASQLAWDGGRVSSGIYLATLTQVDGRGRATQVLQAKVPLTR